MAINKIGIQLAIHFSRPKIHQWSSTIGNHVLENWDISKMCVGLAYTIDPVIKH